MKTILMATAALLIAGAAHGATVKYIWNQGVGENNGYVTSPSACKLDNETRFACYNDHDRPEREPRAPEPPKYEH